MESYAAIFSVVFVASVLYNGRTPFWWLARAFEVLDRGCHIFWRVGGLFLRRWWRETRALMSARKMEPNRG